MLKKPLFFNLALLLIIFFSIVHANEPKLIIKMANEPVLPKVFHSSKNGYRISDSHPPTRQGLDNLNISGSSQFSKASFDALFKALNKPSCFYLFDLREESHGFINGMAVTWYGVHNHNLTNKGKSVQKIEEIEKKLLAEQVQKKYLLLNKSDAKDQISESRYGLPVYPVFVRTIQTEREFIEGKNLHYIRLPVSDHIKPTDEIVDQFISIVKSLPKNRWLHFHCSGGAGRTTTFMNMYDMMNNAKEISFEDIIKRQWYLGGKNMNEHSDDKEWKVSLSKERLQFLKDFYHYCRYNEDNYETSWSKAAYEQAKSIQ